jgi:hypothetical protein
MKALLVMLILAASFTASAQLKGFSIGPYLEGAWPTGKLDQTNKNGIGVGLGADIRFGNVGLVGSVGYMQFPGKTIQTNEGSFKNNSLNAVPIRVGLKFRPIPLLYFKVESGAARLSNDRGSAIIFAPGVGSRLLGLDISGKFETWRKDVNYSFWGAKVSYNF